MINKIENFVKTFLKTKNAHKTKISRNKNRLLVANKIRGWFGHYFADDPDSNMDFFYEWHDEKGKTLSTLIQKNPPKKFNKEDYEFSLFELIPKTKIAIVKLKHCKAFYYDENSAERVPSKIDFYTIKLIKRRKERIRIANLDMDFKLRMKTESR